ncbi:alpha/beta fold hydrolase [Pseudomonas sp. Irchel s3a10]|uniref:alpha/beta fold hydrolase n=1 Tax=Pseudomonas sp. Irchel s3a10 TaxID=2009045 RepID=UPI0035319AA9
MVAADLRGYGDSARPAADEQHRHYSKREMARDNLELMQALGFAQFSILAHDRGARVGHRLALDHRAAVQRMMLLDIAPTLAMYTQTNEAFARAYWHWFFLIRPAPLPETLIEADPAAPDLHRSPSQHSANTCVACNVPAALGAFARTTAPAPASIWNMTGPTSLPAIILICRCGCCGARKARSGAASTHSRSGSKWRPTSVAMRCRPGIIWPKKCPNCCSPKHWISCAESSPVPPMLCWRLVPPVLVPTCPRTKTPCPCPKTCACC